jgi:hypothetical protein
MQQRDHTPCQGKRRKGTAHAATRAVTLAVSSSLSTGHRARPGDPHALLFFLQKDGASVHMLSRACARMSWE